MQHTQSISFLLLFTGCVLLFSLPGGKALADPPQSPEATVKAFFDALSVAAAEGTQPEDLVTSDFIVFEVGTIFNRESFYELIESAATTFKTMEWVLSDFTVTTSDTQAHVSYRNDGRFVDMRDAAMVSYWLESALLVKGNNGWKIKFLQSDLVSRERQRADGSIEIIYPIEPG